MVTGVSVNNIGPSTDRLRETNEGNLPGKGELVSFVILGKTTGALRKGETWINIFVVEGSASIDTIKAGVLEGYLYGGKVLSMQVPPIPLGPRDKLMMFSYNSSSALVEIRGTGRVVP